MEVGREVKTEKTMYIVVSSHQNAGQNHNLLTSNKYSENVSEVQLFENNSNKSKLFSRRN
jgi:hypothetical protein